ncbi:hypothetical protein B566_EDAN014037 [Ephemera danica]|nr:hypothetical protein B566_EDAN014037 [Ephemera danica]
MILMFRQRQAREQPKIDRLTAQARNSLNEKKYLKAQHKIRKLENLIISEGIGEDITQVCEDSLLHRLQSNFKRCAYKHDPRALYKLLKYNHPSLPDIDI